MTTSISSSEALWNNKIIHGKQKVEVESAKENKNHGQTDGHIIYRIDVHWPD